MKHLVTRFLRNAIRNAIKDQRGQILPVFAFFAMGGGLFALGGITLDIGRGYVVQAQLQALVNSEALAASGAVYNASSSTNATHYADLYSATSSSDENDNTLLGTLPAPTITYKCLNMLNTDGSTCTTSSAANAIQVSQTATIRTFFMTVFGQKTLTVTATGTASMQGFAHPWNVAIIVDGTGSMANTDNTCTNAAGATITATGFQCALDGVQAFLGAISPCPSGAANCGLQSSTTGSSTAAPTYANSSSGTTANVAVSLFTFPNVLTSYNGTFIPSIPDELDCSGTPATYSNYSAEPTAAPYTLPKPGATQLANSDGSVYMTYTQTSTNKTWNATYQVTPFLSDYYNASDTGNLNSSSNLVKAVGYGTTKGCLTYTFGIDGPTGGGSNFGNTYIAGAIYEAQAALAAQQANIPNSQNAIIVLSDGYMNASFYTENSTSYNQYNPTQKTQAYEFPGSASSGAPSTSSEVGPSSTAYPVPSYYIPATVNSTTYGYSALGTATGGSGTKGLYPDWFDQCQQAIAAAQYATSKGTTVYAVAYGSEPYGDGCASDPNWTLAVTDTTVVDSGSSYNEGAISLSTLSPCVTMEDIASTLSDFYSDETGNTNCPDNQHSISSLSNIFTAIATSFTSPRLVPNSAAGTTVTN